MSIYNPIQVDLDNIENLSSQCDGIVTNFDFGKVIRGVYWATLGGTLLIETVDFTVNSNKEGITLSIAPGNGEQLYAKVLI